MNVTLLICIQLFSDAEGINCLGTHFLTWFKNAGWPIGFIGGVRETLGFETEGIVGVVDPAIFAYGASYEVGGVELTAFHIGVN